MDREKAQELYLKHSRALAYIEIENPSGDRGIGSCFHIGEGVFVTARHVLENNRILEIKISEPVGIDTREHLVNLLGEKVTEEKISEYNKWYKSVSGRLPLFKHYLDSLKIESGPYYPNNINIDLAIFKVSNLHHAVPSILLGLHFDDWIYRGFWHLSNAIVLGYPPIPMVNYPTLIAAKAEIHTYVVPRHCPHVHFILSSTPRGGFSGGVAIHESGNALGVITSSFVENDQPEQLGFLSVLSIEPIHNLLEQLHLMPKIQKEHHDNLLKIK